MKIKLFGKVITNGSDGRDESKHYVEKSIISEKIILSCERKMSMFSIRGLKLRV